MPRIANTAIYLHCNIPAEGPVSALPQQARDVCTKSDEGSSWLTTLTCSCCLQREGDITYNGRSLKEFIPERTAAYVTQYDNVSHLQSIGPNFTAGLSLQSLLQNKAENCDASLHLLGHHELFSRHQCLEPQQQCLPALISFRRYEYVCSDGACCSPDELSAKRLASRFYCL